MSDKTRKAFEAYWRPNRENWRFEITDKGDYFNIETEVYWLAWQAATARAMAEAVRVCDELYALKSEYDKAYTKGQDGAASMIWQSIQKGPGNTPEWALEEVKRPGGGLFWTNGERRVHFDYPPIRATLRSRESGDLTWD